MPSTIKLDLCNVDLHGREAEFSVLQEAFRRVTDSKSNASEVVLVHGYAGTGKSTLIRKLQTWIMESDEGCGYFVTGKFDQQRSTEPYYALTSAFNELCDLILSSTDKDRTKASFMEAVGSKGQVLVELVPKLNQLLGNIEGRSGSFVAKGTTTALNQLKFVFRAFIRAVCTVTQHPVVLFLDDLQWADVPSLELIKSMLTDSKATQVLFIGSFRDNEVDDTHPFTTHMRDVEKEKEVTRIPLGDLDKETVNLMVSRLTELNPTTTLPLTEIVYQKTHGNIFFVIQFLKLLEDEKLLSFSLTNYKWTWDMDRIKAETQLSDNVVDLVAGKIKRLPANARAILKLASCLWSTFDVEVLRHMLENGWKKYEKEDDKCTQCCLSASSNLVELLDLATEEGLLDKLSETKYKFAHDRIQQAAYSIIPEGRERDTLHHHTGELLWEMAESPKREEWMWFAAADQLNRGSALITDDTAKVELAELNLAVGKKAIALSAFVPAANYLQSGIEHLPLEKRWSDHYDLSLQLHNSLANMEYCNGNAERTQQIVEEVLANAMTCKEKITALDTFCLSLVSQGKQREALEVACSMLRKLGEPFPKRVTRATISFECIRLGRWLRGKSDEDLLSIPPMKNEEKIAAMKFYDLSANCYAHLGMMRHSSLVAMRMMRLSLKYGPSELSPVAYALWATVLAAEGYTEEGYRGGKLAIKLSERLNSKMSMARVVGVVSSFLNHWREPLQQNLDPLLQAYKTAMLAGDTTHAFQCILGYQLMYFYGGLPLPAGVDDLIAYSKQMQEYKQLSTRRAQLPILQLMLNLMGRSNDVLLLTGEVMDQKEYESIASNPAQMGLQTIDSCRMQLAYYFNDLELAAELSRKLQKLTNSELFASSYFICVRYMFFGLISIELARRTKKRRHAADATRIIAHIEKSWVKKGAVNCLHKLLILKAEYTTLKYKDAQQVKDAFDKAISTTKRIGFIQDEALANEKAGMFFLEEGDKFWASTYLSRAHELYTEWGAKAKADQLDTDHGSLLTHHEEHKGSGSSLRGRRRFSTSTSKKRQTLRGLVK